MVAPVRRLCLGWNYLLRSGEVETRRAHNPEIAGANPASATKRIMTQIAHMTLKPAASHRLVGLGTSVRFSSYTHAQGLDTEELPRIQAWNPGKGAASE